MRLEIVSLFRCFSFSREMLTSVVVFSMLLDSQNAIMAASAWDSSFSELCRLKSL